MAGQPRAGFGFAQETARRKPASISEPFVIGVVLELGSCLDLTTTAGIKWVKIAYESLARSAATSGVTLPANSADGFRRNLDCAVIRRLHSILEAQSLPAVDTVKGVFTEGKPIYPGSGFDERTHIQIVVCNQHCIKGVFRISVAERSRKTRLYSKP